MEEEELPTTLFCVLRAKARFRLCMCSARSACWLFWVGPLDWPRLKAVSLSLPARGRELLRFSGSRFLRSFVIAFAAYPVAVSGQERPLLQLHVASSSYAKRFAQENVIVANGASAFSHQHRPRSARRRVLDAFWGWRGVRVCGLFLNPLSRGVREVGVWPGTKRASRFFVHRVY